MPIFGVSAAFDKPLSFGRPAESPSRVNRSLVNYAFRKIWPERGRANSEWNLGCITKGKSRSLGGTDCSRRARTAMLTISSNLFRAPRISFVRRCPGVRSDLRTKLAGLFFAVVFICSMPLHALAVNTAIQNASPSGTSEPVAHGPSPRAEEIAKPFGFPITNSMIASWIVAAGLIVFAQVATRHMKLIPDGIQNFWEWLVEGLYTFLEGIIGSHLVQRTFWFFASIFIFILTANWAGLIPGAGTIGLGHTGSHGFIVDHPLFRGANADVNLTFAMALVFFACWFIWALQEIGPVGFLKELFAPKGDTAGPMKIIMVVVFFASGCLEIISILFRPVSLSFRLYGNVFAGENMLETMSTLVPHLGWLLPIPFYFLELLVGLIQALVFMLLTAVFTLLICQHEKEPAAAQS
jgi:F-type H+-transporting ATPase subunit a